MNLGQNTSALVSAIKGGVENYVDFKGEANRPTFWWWILFVALSGIAATALYAGLGAAWNVALLLPTLSIGVRRLRDAGYHWAWMFLGLVPIVGGIVLIVFFTQPTKARASED